MTFRHGLDNGGPFSTQAIRVNSVFYVAPCNRTMPLHEFVGSSGRAVERRTVNRGDGGSIPPTAVSKLRQFRLPHICLCISEETLNACGPICHLSHTGDKCVTCSGLTNSRWTLNPPQRARPVYERRRKERKSN